MCSALQDNYRGVHIPPARPRMALYWAFCTTSYHEGRKRADFNSNSNQKRDLILRTMHDSRDDDGFPARDWAAIDRTLPDEGITQDIQKKVDNVVAKADKKKKPTYEKQRLKLPLIEASYHEQTGGLHSNRRLTPSYFPLQLSPKRSSTPHVLHILAVSTGEVDLPKSLEPSNPSTWTGEP